MDLNMPVMNGFQSTKCIKALMEEKTLPRMNIVGTTADYIDGRLKKRCKTFGFAEIISKPVKKTILKQIL